MAYVKPEEIVASMLEAGAKKASLPVKHLLIRGFLAGAFLGYATTLAILAATQTGWGIVGAAVFPVGFVMIVLLGLELATGNFALIPIAVKAKRVSLSFLLKNWTGVLIGNLTLVTSDRDCARELCADAALYVDPHDPVSMAAAIAAVILDKRLAGSLVAAGSKQLQRQYPSGRQKQELQITLIDRLLRQS